jgi:acetyl esterase/lipase
MKALLLAAFATVPLMSAQQLVIPLWPEGAPNAQPNLGPEHNSTTPKDGRPGGRDVTRLTDVTSPTMTFYPAPTDKNSGAAVVVFPGGGYRILAYDLEGTEVCDWLTGIGVNCLLIKYRVPEAAGVPRYQAPLEDAKQAMNIAHSRAAEWKIDPNRIGVLGFSAGGHLCATLLQARPCASVGAADTHCSEFADGPSFAILVYPAYLSIEDKGQEISPEVQPAAGTPPLFIVQAEDDHTYVPGTLLYYRALQAAKIPAELHIYETGGHGYGLRPTDAPVTRWPQLAEAWMRLHHFIR